MWPSLTKISYEWQAGKQSCEIHTEFGNIIICTVYVQPKAKAYLAARAIADCVHKQLEGTLEAPCFVQNNVEKYSGSSELNRYGSRFKYSKFLNIIDKDLRFFFPYLLNFKICNTTSCYV